MTLIAHLHESVLRKGDYALIAFFALFFVVVIFLYIAYGIREFGGPL